MKIKVVAKEVLKCSLFKEGDKFVVDGAEIVMDETDRVCIHALCAFFPIISALSKGIKFEDYEIGKGNKGKLRCPDQEGVIFELERIEDE